MLIKSGTHEGKTPEQVILTCPDWVEWLMHEHPENNLVERFEDLINIFDSKSLIEKCCKCKAKAKQASAYVNSSIIYFWCDRCDPYSAGANQGKLRLVRIFQDVM